ncbi:DUF2937 family protein [Horticoccus luteus]|uniref:DUF2937 family protein n=2 Tax=Horticoccus luteus TaxID=2862869 RepID=A0A8F9XI05_9BACT|nr:DUF2937 family protein [Horticoccus luteus]
MRWTRPFSAAGTAGGKFLDRAACVAGALVFSQAPEFMQQYLQRLGGHLDEARRQLQQFQAVATQSGLTLDELIAKTSGNADAAVARLGGVMHAAAERADSLYSAETALRTASLWERPFVFLRHLDPGIARATWSVFKPAVPTTMEGLVYAAIGVAVALLLVHVLCVWPCRAVLRRRRRHKRVVDGTAGAVER